MTKGYAMTVEEGRRLDIVRRALGKEMSCPDVGNCTICDQGLGGSCLNIAEAVIRDLARYEP